MNASGPGRPHPRWRRLVLVVLAPCLLAGVPLVTGCGASASGPGAARTVVGPGGGPPAPARAGTSPNGPAPSSTSTVPGAASAQTTPAAPGTATGQPGQGVAGQQAPAPVESNPVGDIPDTVHFVAYTDPGHAFGLTYPEGWVQAATPGGSSFADKLDSITVSVGPAGGPVTPASFRSRELASLGAAQPAFALTSVESAVLPAGTGVLVRYLRNSAPDPVTTRQHRDEVLRYEIGTDRRRAVLELADPVGADNVDAFGTVAQSLRLP